MSSSESRKTEPQAGKEEEKTVSDKLASPAESRSESETKGATDEESDEKTSKTFGQWISETVTTLLTTSETLDEKADELRDQYFSEPMRYCLGFLFRGCVIGVFGYFFATFFIQFYITQKFVALTSTAGNCESVGRSWSTEIDLDYYGSWRGQLAFNATASMYGFSIHNFFATTPSMYTEFMKHVSGNLTFIGNLAVNRDLAYNLLYWSSWALYLNTTVPSGNIVTQVVNMRGDAQAIIAGNKYGGTVANQDADCPLFQSTEDFYGAASQLLMTFSVSTIGADSKCNRILYNTPSNPFLNNLGWDPLVSGDTATFSVDVHTLFSALAVSYQVNGVNSLNTFLTARELSRATYKNGIEYQLVEKFDPNYPGMDPMVCVGPVGSTSSNGWNCFLRIGDSFGAPFFQHQGSDSSFPTPCDCSSSAGRSVTCDAFNFLAGVIIYDYTLNASVAQHYVESFRPVLPLMELFYDPPPVSAAMAGKLIFPAAYAATLGQNNPVFTDKGWRENQYGFSKTSSFGAGSIITWQITSYTGAQGVTEDNYQLTNGACSDSFTSPHFTSLYEPGNAWGDLNEAYFKCTAKLSDAVLNAAGIAGGNIEVFVPKTVQFITFFLVAITALVYGVPEVEEEEEGEAIDEITGGTIEDELKGGPSSLGKTVAAAIAASGTGPVGFVSPNAPSIVIQQLRARGITNLEQLFRAMEISPAGVRDLVEVAGFELDKPAEPFIRHFESIIKTTSKELLQVRVRDAFGVNIATACDITEYLRRLYPSSAS